MSDVKLVLVPTDFSALADAATDTAGTLAAGLNARVVLLHVVRVSDYALGEGVFAVLDAIREDVMRTAAADVEARARRLRERGVSCETRVVEGVPAEAILTAIDTARPDLVVMGTHGRTGVRRLFVGSVAQAVVAHSTKPVLLVPIAATR